MNRRAFIKLCGCAGCGVLFTVAGCGRPETVSTAEQAQADSLASPTATPEPAATAVATTAAGSLPAAAAAAATATATVAATALPRTGKVACPKGQYWDPYPGRCKLYRDTNGNGYCDWSEPA